MIKHIRRKFVNFLTEGWSTKKQWNLFHDLIKKNSTIKNAAVLGVYRGKDLAYLCYAFKHAKINNFHIYAVDIFENIPCSDWGPEYANKSWEEAFNLPPPSLEKSKFLIKTLGFEKNVTFIKGDFKKILNIKNKLDFAYIDVSHDYKTTKRAIEICIKKGSKDMIIMGDDYANLKALKNSSIKWGVVEAVNESFKKFQIHYNWFWESKKKFFKKIKKNNNY